MTFRRIHLGQKGEDLAVLYLKEKGYEILERNVRGPRGEIDIVARDQDTICFIEVKTRSSDARGMPAEAVLFSKQKKLAYLALNYIKSKQLEENRLRFDVVSVFWEQNSPAKVELIQNAFEVNY